MNNDKLNILLLKILEGDQCSFEILYNETKKGVFSFLYTYFHNYHDTEDAMQMVYLKIKKGISTYKPNTNASAWILQIAKNYALTQLKNQKENLSLDELSNTIVDNKQGDFEFYGVTKIIQSVLSVEEQRILSLHVLWGYKHREIAKIFNCPTGTITSKYKRLVAKIKKALKEGEL
ncbi:MAG: sigma-70 family RNA polymerase sigma factor [Clostridia bacterium]|nr:sigma-70 family RNA polymerase sigma factor [Clostridia bacterium]